MLAVPWLAVAMIAFSVAPTLAAPAIHLVPIGTGLAEPTAITHAGDGSGRLFITLQRGRIVIHDGTRVLPTPFLDIASLVSCCGERGLLGLAFHPRYATDGRFYVLYTNTAGAVVVARYTVSTSDPDRAQPSGAVLLTIPKPFANHNGGQLAFGPDGYLYIGVGDGGGAGDTANNAQNLGSLLGKILRIDVDGPAPYAIPPANPFAGIGGARGEIWAYGLRNPWRFSFDQLTGDLFIGDVGQGMWEEVNLQPASSPGGENYGWRRMEGAHCFNPSSGCNDGTLTLPIIEYPHGAVGANPPDCSITGGYRYRGAGVPALAHRYVFGDLCSGRILSATPAGTTWTMSPLLDTPHQISTFGEDETGELYVARYGEADGAVYRIVPPGRGLPDFDGDGTGDILWRNSAGALTLWRMSGGSLGSSTALGTVPADWAIADIGDLDGDGKADVLWRNAIGALSLWLMNGASAKSTVSLGVLDPAWRIVGLGDFNGDGQADILWRRSTGAVSLWLMNGGAVIGTAGLGVLDPAVWQVAGLGDFDGDGKTDILWRNGSGAVSLWLMNGGSVIGTAGLGVLDPAVWQLAGLGDFSGDGKTDILWRSASGTVSLWLMNGSRVIGTAGLRVPEPGVWQVAGLGDLSGDGQADILWRSTGGTLALWLMTGGQVSDTLGLGTVTTIGIIQ